MKNLQFSYVMKTLFIEEIVEHSFSLKCVPQSDARQTIEHMEFELFPPAKTGESMDAFGNQMIYGRLREAHDLFVVKINGTVTVTDNQLPQTDETKTWMYKYPTRATTAGEVLQLFGKKIAALHQGDNALTLAEQMMHEVHKKMHYQTAVTGMSTTAEEAFTIGKGVCQDYAHILLALLRQISIPARYVVGMMIGEGASHAWVEVFINGYWVGLDPTNDQYVDDTYIKISHGRDAGDCLVEQGIFIGHGGQQKLVGVKVTEE